MKSNLELKFDLFILQAVRQAREGKLLSDMFRNAFNEEHFQIIQDNQWTDKETGERFL